MISQVKMIITMAMVVADVSETGQNPFQSIAALGDAEYASSWLSIASSCADSHRAVVVWPGLLAAFRGPPASRIPCLCTKIGLLWFDKFYP